MGYVAATKYGGGRHIIVVAKPESLYEVSQRIQNPDKNRPSYVPFDIEDLSRRRMHVSELRRVHQNLDPLPLQQDFPDPLVENIAVAHWCIRLELGNIRSSY